VRTAKFEPPLVVYAIETPRQAPVSTALRLADDAQRKPSYEATLRVIDAVHDDGGLTPIPLTETRATVNVGGYAWAGKNGLPLGIDVSRAGRHPELTLVHEVGHFIDHQALGKKGEFASEKSSLLEVWRKIVLATPTAKKLKLAATGKQIEGQWARGTPEEYAELLPLRELWARAYAQYIAAHSGNPALLAQLEVARVPLNGLRFWQDDEFEAIALAITTILTSKKW
jgi:hypothetical protein